MKDTKNTENCISASKLKQDELFTKSIDFNELLLDKNNSKYLVAVAKNNQHSNFKIFTNDWLIINSEDFDLKNFDSEYKFYNDKLVLVRLQDEFSIKKCKIIDGEKYLMNADGIFLPLKIENYINYQIIGIVSKIIHNL